MGVVVARKGEEKNFDLNERGIGRYYAKAVGKSLSYLKKDIIELENNGIRER
jgi:hypothetical protein